MDANCFLCGSSPRVDDRLVEPEVTRDEIIGGRRIVASPSEPPKAILRSRLNYLLAAHVVPGYLAATDLLTRFDEESDFATDACVLRDGLDPTTGGRYLEEPVFRVALETDESDVTERAVRMSVRGVRRIFMVRVEGQQVCEWSAGDQSWRRLTAGSQIEDLCFVAPITLSALFDDIAADNAVVEALLAKDDPPIRLQETKGKAKGLAEGEARGRARSIFKVLEARGVAVTELQRQEIQSCHDLDRLERWLLRAIRASSADEITSEP